ncbi:MAG: sigma-54-dependent Fis family transcriptional regulator [Planctomycetota bacterium]|nr:MAG: sigma-54-dependent Fis family transcriptional regulator [Planctomycetota bacterium]
MANILVIDDNPTNRDTYSDILEGEGHTVLSASSGEEGLAKLTAAAVDCVLCDLKLPGLDGLETMELAHEKHGRTPWILITGHGSEEIAVRSIKQGAFNYLTKPVDLQRLKATMESAAQTAGLSRENKALRRELGYDEALDRIVGTSPATKAMKATIRQVAHSHASVLIEGESGTGKELVADAIHTLSGRSARPYVKLNTAAIPRDLLESELFGHERGAFTGAVAQKKGKFEVADTGTLFLDEIGEMSMDAQVKLLRVLQDGHFSRVGGNVDIAGDVRLICATNRNLKQEVLDGNFRMDLYYRLNVVNIHVPSLRERREDIPLLAKNFVDRLNQRHGGNKVLNEESMEVLRRMDWPGNIRELENTVEKLYVLSEGASISASILRQERSFAHTRLHDEFAAAPQPSPAGNTANQEDAIASLVGLPMDEVERRMIIATLDHCQGNKSKAARLLRIGLKTLYRKLEAYQHDTTSSATAP